jgi:hypothetical protein
MPAGGQLTSTAQAKAGEVFGLVISPPGPTLPAKFGTRDEGRKIFQL